MRAAAYVRQSIHLAEGIDRQRRRCEELIRARGWLRAGEYVDNDVSASGARGPKTAWGSLIRDARAGKIDAVVAVDLDRLLRSQRDLLTLIDLNLKVVTVDGDIDLTTADGTFRATMATALARFEVQRKSERQRRASEHNRALGKPAPGPRVFGYTALPEHAPLEPEAAAVRRAYAEAGSISMGAIARDWNAAGLTNTRGAPWTQQAVRGVLSSPRYAGKIVGSREKNSGTDPLRYDPLQFTNGSWEPLVRFDQWLSVRRFLTDQTRQRKRAPANKKLLIGCIRCVDCGGYVGSGNNRGDAPTYRCLAGHVQVRAARVDDYVSTKLIERLSAVDARRLLAGRVNWGAEHKALLIREARQRLLTLVAQGSATMREATAALAASNEWLREIETDLIANDVALVIRPILEAPEGVQSHWDEMPIEAQRLAVQAVLTVVIRGTGRGRGERPVEEYVFIAWN